MSGSYNHPNHLVVREHCAGATIFGTAGTLAAHWAPKQKARLLSVQAVVVVAGTATNDADILVGTTSVGSIAVGTNTAGSIVTSGSLDVAVAAGERVTIDGDTTDATGSHIITYEWMAEIDSVHTAKS